MEIQPGIFYKDNPCAIDGQGETVELVSGTVLFGYADETVNRVDYQDVIGLGTTSGVEYKVTYSERRAGSSRISLSMISTDSSFTERTIIDSHGKVTSRQSCS